jgi:DNA primase
MQLLSGVGSGEAAIMPRVLAHYASVAPLLEASFSGAPVVFETYPFGLDKPGLRHVTPFELDAKRVLWLIHAKHAIEFFTSAPVRNDENRLRFARIVLDAPPGVGFARVKRAALVVADILRTDHKLHAIPVLDGGNGIVLWIPLADTPRADQVRGWLHVFVNHVATLHRDVVTTEPNTREDGRVHADVSSNEHGRYGALPYTLHAQGLSVCAPVQWTELDSIESAAAFTIETFGDRLRAHGDLFARELGRIGRQSSPCTAEWLMYSRALMPHGQLVSAALEVLSDGRVRSAHEILTAALARKLVPPETTHKHVHAALLEYVARQIGQGRTPPFVHDTQRRFHMNETLNDWPALLPQRAPDDRAAVVALCDRLEATSHGKDPAAFEVAVCDAFAHLGFLAQHLGQHGAPDGIADAMLGIDGFRIVFKCNVENCLVSPEPAALAAFRDAYNAQYCVLVGPEFGEETEPLHALQEHDVTAIAVPELQALLHAGVGALEVQSVLKAGYASDAVADVLWERMHGNAQRLATVAFLLQRDAWRAQRLAVLQNEGPLHSPLITVDAAMLMVDEALQEYGATNGCTRDEVQRSFEYLASPNVGLARLEHECLVALKPPSLSSRA